MRPGLYAFAAAAVFLGATIYIGFVEHPARLKLSGPAMIQEWKLSNRRGTLTLSVFAVVSAILAYIQFRANGDVRWLIGGATILAGWRRTRAWHGGRRSTRAWPARGGCRCVSTAAFAPSSSRRPRSTACEAARWRRRG